MSASDTALAAFEMDGRLWLRQAIDAQGIERLKRSVSLGARPGQRVGRSDPLFDAVCEGAVTRAIRSIWSEAAPVRLLVFDKTDASNWQLGWHQDRVIAVDRCAALPGFSQWTRKAGLWHCEPPEAVLARMLFVRVHLDAQTEHNGAMQIAVGSHREGRIASADMAHRVAQYPVETTTAAAGDVLVLAMHTAHRSPAASDASARAVLRVDFTLAPLPEPLQWA